MKVELKCPTVDFDSTQKGAESGAEEEPLLSSIELTIGLCTKLPAGRHSVEVVIVGPDGAARVAGSAILTVTHT